MSRTALGAARRPPFDAISELTPEYAPCGLRGEKVIERHPTATRFDKAYYDRYYRDPRTRAVSPAAARRQAAFLAHYLRHLEIRVGSILDVGCGTGTVLRALGREYPRARCQGVDVSDYLSRRYGWTRGSVVDYRAPASDLVICNDVLGYLSDAECTKALKNLTELTRSALYLGVLTREDLPLCDPERTDAAQLARPAGFYRRRLARNFVAVGGGLFLKKPLTVTVWHLERL